MRAIALLALALPLVAGAQEGGFRFNGVEGSAASTRDVGFAVVGGDPLGMTFQEGLGQVRMEVTDRIGGGATYGDRGTVGAELRLPQGRYRIALDLSGNERRSVAGAPAGGVAVNVPVHGGGLGLPQAVGTRAAFAIAGVGSVWRDDALLTDNAIIYGFAITDGTHADDNTHQQMNAPRSGDTEIELLVANVPGAPGGFLRLFWDEVSVNVGGTSPANVLTVENVQARNPEQVQQTRNYGTFLVPQTAQTATTAQTQTTAPRNGTGTAFSTVNQLDVTGGRVTGIQTSTREQPLIVTTTGRNAGSTNNTATTGSGAVDNGGAGATATTTGTGGSGNATATTTGIGGSGRTTATNTGSGGSGNGAGTSSSTDGSGNTTTTTGNGTVDNATANNSTTGGTTGNQSTGIAGFNSATDSTPIGTTIRVANSNPPAPLPPSVRPLNSSPAPTLPPTVPALNSTTVVALPSTTAATTGAITPANSTGLSPISQVEPVNPNSPAIGTSASQFPGLTPSSISNGQPQTTATVGLPQSAASGVGVGSGIAGTANAGIGGSGTFGTGTDTTVVQSVNPSTLAFQPTPPVFGTSVTPDSLSSTGFTAGMAPQFTSGVSAFGSTSAAQSLSGIVPSPTGGATSLTALPTSGINPANIPGANTGGFAGLPLIGGSGTFPGLMPSSITPLTTPVPATNP